MKWNKYTIETTTASLTFVLLAAFFCVPHDVATIAAATIDMAATFSNVLFIFVI